LLPFRCRAVAAAAFAFISPPRHFHAAAMLPISLPPRHLFRFHYADADAIADAADAVYFAVTPLFSCRRFHFHA
jgi:hypothetical protein